MKENEFLKADLHMHTTASDGGYEAVTLVQKCSEAGLHLISVTDHDTTEALAPAAAEAEKCGIRFIDGIELSTRYDGKSVDILGYGIDPDSASLQEMLAFQRDSRVARMKDMITLCREQGMLISEEEVCSFVTGETYSRPHLAKALVAKGYVSNVSEAFALYIGYGKPCYVHKRDEMSPAQAIRLIHEAGGAAVVAHPVFYEIDHVIPEWVKQYGLEGIEVYHRDHDNEAIARFSGLADQIDRTQQVSLLRTGGSDFHHESFGRDGEEIGATKLPCAQAEAMLTKLNIS